jgi:uncharacterized protein (TIGR03437 family)
MAGKSAVLSWSAVGATSCIASGAWGGSYATSGTQTVTFSSAGAYTYTLNCFGGGGILGNATATLTVINPAGTSEGVTGLPSDITPLLSIAGVWQPVADQYITSSNTGWPGNTFFGNILLPNGKEGLVVTGWSNSNLGTPTPTSVTPFNIAILEQQQDGTLLLATPKYVSDPQANGGGSVIVADFNGDGTQDFFVAAHNESPAVPAASTAYLSTPNGTYSKVTIADQVEAHDGELAYIGGTPTVFTGSYYVTSLWADPVEQLDSTNGFAVIPYTGTGGNSSVAVADFYGTGAYSAVYGDFSWGPNFPFDSGLAGIYLYQLTDLVPAGTAMIVGNPYFDTPQYAQLYQSTQFPYGRQHNYRVWTDDFNHDDKLDIIVEGCIYISLSASTTVPLINVLQMFQNTGNYQFKDVTDALDSHYDKTTFVTDYVPQVRDVDSSGINSYLLAGTTSLIVPQPASNYVIVNDGTGNLQVALHEALNTYGQQILAWLDSHHPSGLLGGFGSMFQFTSSEGPKIRAYQTPNGLLNFVAMVDATTNNSTFTHQIVFVNVPLQLDITHQFTKAITVNNRNGSHLIRTFAGDDTIHSGNNGRYSKVDGGLGTNTVVYAGPSQNYSATHNADTTWTIKDNVGADGTDTLTRIQRLQFTDILVRLDTPTVVGPASSVSATAGAGQSATINTAFPTALQVTVRDFLGNPVPNVTVIFTAPGTGASGTFPGPALSATATTNNAGVATAPAFTANGTIGPVKVTATAAGVVTPAIFSLTNDPRLGTIASIAVAGGGTGIAQNTWIVIKGTNLVPSNAPAAGVTWSGAPEFASGQMPTQLAGFPVTVTVNNKPAFIYFFCSAVTSSTCTSDQINVLTPLDSTVGSVPVVVTNGGISSAPFTVNMAAAAPSFPLVGATQYVVATHADNSLVGPVSLSVPAYPFTPARPGETIVLYGFGFGLPTTALANGSSAQSGALPSLPVITIGGASATVTFAGAISPGLYQLNVVVPTTAQSGDNPLACTYNGLAAPAGDLIAIQQ